MLCLQQILAVSFLISFPPPHETSYLACIAYHHCLFLHYLFPYLRVVRLSFLFSSGHSYPPTDLYAHFDNLWLYDLRISFVNVTLWPLAVLTLTWLWCVVLFQVGVLRIQLRWIRTWTCTMQRRVEAYSGGGSRQGLHRCSCALAVFLFVSVLNCSI